MKSITIAAVLLCALFGHGGRATYDWNNAQNFLSPVLCDNQCSSDQVRGWTWANVSHGNLNSYDGIDFTGFQCQDSFDGNGGALSKRTQWDSKCIVGRATTDDASCPTISSSDRNFSITSIQVSVETNSSLTFEYLMPDGSTCRHTSSCTTEGTTVHNNQCGGARHVKIKGDCTFRFHEILFDCTSGPPITSVSTTSTPSTSTSCGSTSSTLATFTSTSGTTTPNTSTSSTSTSGIATSLAPLPTTYTNSTLCNPMQAFSGGMCVPRTTSVPVSMSMCEPGLSFDNSQCISSTSSRATTSPLSNVMPGSTVCTSESSVASSFTRSDDISSTAAATSSSATTEAIVSSASLCPDTRGTGTTCPTGMQSSALPDNATAQATSDGITSSSTSPAFPTSEAPCPTVLPRCFSTWMFRAVSCSSNSDLECFCPSADFIGVVQECVTAWAGSDSDVQGAFSYLVGICADFVSQNPGICTGVPASVSLVPTPSPSASSFAMSTGVNTASVTPSTVIVYTQTEATTMITQTVTVPQVSFNTVTEQVAITNSNMASAARSTQAVGLVPAYQSSTEVATSSDKTTTISTLTTTSARSALSPSTKVNASSPTFTGGAPHTNTFDINPYLVAALLLGV